MQKLLNKLFNWFCLIFLLVVIQPVYGVDKISFNVEEIAVKDWKLTTVSLSLLDLQSSKQQFRLSSKHLSFPKPFSDIKLFDVHCQNFTWQDDRIVCQHGSAKLKSKLVSATPFAFSFFITEKNSQISIKNLRIAKGRLSINAKQNGENWTLTLKSKNILLKHIQPFLKETKFEIDEITDGKVYADIEAKGKGAELNLLLIKALFNTVSLQANQGKLALQSLEFNLDLLATRKNANWHWQNKNQVKQGEIYVEPFYMEIKNPGLQIESDGVKDERSNIVLDRFIFNHPDVININAEALITNDTQYKIDSAYIFTTIDNLEIFSADYISPLLEQTEFEGIKLKGQARSAFKISQSVVQKVDSEILNLNVTDEKNRMSIENAKGEIHWANNSDSNMPSKIQWDKIKLLAIPIDANELKFLLNKKSVKLLQKSSLSLLGGFLNIERFNWQHLANEEASVYFEGSVDNLSLEQLTHALDWTPLTGSISGDIPGVNYKDKTLTINGELKVEVFDGIIRINQLASSGLFTDFSKLYMDMEMENLDLHAITKKIKMGGIEGRLSGYIKNAYLENWKPVTFYAWFGTPEDDNSLHRISQQAVENIASIGGGGAADVISKGFLRFFDTFAYDRIGFGCYLYQGACQMMGVEAAEKGFYLVKGGGLPRIDIVGFNPRVDWNVLIERLSRIADTDDVIVE